MSTYTADIVLQNTTNATMTDVMLIHAWPQGPSGGVGEVVLWLPELKGGTTSSPGTVNSGTGGFDYFMLFFNISSVAGLQAMGPTDVQIVQKDANSQISFLVEADNQIAFSKPNTPDPSAGIWGPVQDVPQFTSTSSTEEQEPVALRA